MTEVEVGLRKRLRIQLGQLLIDIAVHGDNHGELFYILYGEINVFHRSRHGVLYALAYLLVEDRFRFEVGIQTNEDEWNQNEQKVNRETKLEGLNPPICKPMQ
ncbi:Uncharacterised protein [Chlamydia abortus]|nr:Uncharacterised protein [Chlamydia abortus]